MFRSREFIGLVIFDRVGCNRFLRKYVYGLTSARVYWVGAEQIETFKAKKTKVTLEEFKYAPESYERALSIGLGTHAQLNDWQAWRRCKVWLVEDVFFPPAT